MNGAELIFTSGGTESIGLAVLDRLRVLEGEPLEAGWAGKPHALVQLAAAARAMRKPDMA